MVSAIQTIILSYINKYHSISLSEIQEVVNEPLTMLASEVRWLYDNQYFERLEGEELCVTDKAKVENIREWNIWLKKEKDEDKFCADIDYQIKRDKNNYPVISTTEQLREILQLEYIDLMAYHVFLLRIKGKERKITAPSRNLKKRQKWILNNILYNYKLLDCVHGFVNNKSIVSNAKCHIAKLQIGCIDIQDFFPSIDDKMVEKVFCDMGYAEKIAEEMSRICTYENTLPQGAPTSPMLANIVLTSLDSEMQQYADQYGLSYSRYADDLTISGNCDIDVHVEAMINKVERLGFNVNKEKTHIMKEPYRKIVTGLVVTDIVKVPKRYKRTFRQEIYYCKKWGINQHLKNIGRTSAVNFKEYMYGKAYFIKMVEPIVGNVFLKDLDELFSMMENRLLEENN